MDLVTRFKRAIAIEQEADAAAADTYVLNYSAKQLAWLGLAITNLVVASTRTGLGGKTMFELEVDSAVKLAEAINSGSIRVGDIVQVKAHGEDKVDFGAVVTKITDGAVTVATEDDVEIGESRVWIVKTANAITYQRMNTAMNKLGEITDKSDVMKLITGEMPFTEPPKGDPMHVINRRLNHLQVEAVDFALRAPVTIIQGPPGTGKTYTLIELIQQCVSRGERVLVCGPSNISVDTILERLSGVVDAKRKKKHSTGLVRIGHPARLLESNLKHLLDVLTKSPGDDNRLLLNDITKEIGDTWGQIRKCKRYGERRQLYAELKDLKKEFRTREKRVVSDILCKASVVVATLHGAGAYELTSLYKDPGLKFGFDTIIIDEVSQSVEPQCWIPLVNHPCKRLVIAGDNQQLPPTVKGPSSVLSTTLFDRLVNDLDGAKVKKLLDVQYRMNEAIMKFPLKVLYGDKLIADETVRHITLQDIGCTNPDVADVLIWHDTQGGGYSEQVEDSPLQGASKYNEMETTVVWEHVAALIESGVKAADIGIITPYSAQVRMLRLQNEHGVEVATVDGFQGREKEVIVLLLVRSNDDREVGFLLDERRLNVAMTRAKRQLCVVGDMELLEQCSVTFLNQWALFAETLYEITYPMP